MTDKLTPQDQENLTVDLLQDRLEDLQAQITRQEAEIEALNQRLPDTNIISPNFLVRAFTVWGHYVVAGFIIAIPFICLSIFFVIIMSLFSQQ